MIPKRIRRFFARDKRSPVELLQADILLNPFHPFQLGLSFEDRSRMFTLRKPYKKKKSSQITIAVCLAILLLMLATWSVNNSIFVYVITALIHAIAVFVNYRHERIYLLDEENKVYSFIVGSDFITSGYHNIYIRLNRILQVGASSNEIPKYELVLDGVKIDRHVLTKRPSSDVRSLRRLGQKIARNLNINYFDQANVSVFHNVRHYPESE